MMTKLAAALRSGSGLFMSCCGYNRMLSTTSRQRLVRGKPRRRLAERADANTAENRPAVTSARWLR